MKKTSYLALIKVSAIYDIAVTTVFALPWLSHKALE